jgi:hypothetical protein
LLRPRAYRKRMFSLPDLFLVGTALDLVGGYLIACGLLIRLPVLAVRAGTFWGGNPTVAIGAVEDRANAITGLLTLSLGFTLQATGYLVEIGWSSSAGVSVGRAVTGAVVSIVIAAVALQFARMVRERLVRRDLLTLARLDVNDVRGTPKIADHPELKTLASYARAWRGAQPEETDEEAVSRVFGAVETRVAPTEGTA